jgi:hypothetical protein
MLTLSTHFMMVHYKALQYANMWQYPNMALYPKLIGTTSSVCSYDDWELDWEAIYNNPYEPSYQLPEAAMQAAGRIPSHTYRDLRSARRSYQRTRKHPHKSPRRQRQCSCCQVISSNQSRRARKRGRQDELHRAYDEYTSDDEWWYYEEREIACECNFVRGCQQSKPEDFGTWARRRINEARAVKEARLQSPRLAVPTTTLPTILRDAYGHTVLTDFLMPNTSFMHFLSPSLLHVCGMWRSWKDYECFADYSGLWEWEWAFCERCMYKNCVRGCTQWVCCNCKGGDEVCVARSSGWALLGDWRWAERDKRVGRVVGKNAEGEEWDIVSNVSEEWSVVSII